MKYVMKRNLLILFWVLTALSVSAQDAKSCFLQIPDTLLPLLTEVNCADCIDFLESKMKAEVTNRLGGKSEMTALTADYIRLQTTPQSSWQMKLLPLNDSTSVVCTVSTVCAPACDSHLQFYTTAWEPLPESSFLPPRPLLADFIAAPADTTNVYRYADARRQADMLLLRADLSPTDHTLTFTFTTPDYMTPDAVEVLKPYLREALLYRWKEGRWIRE